MKKTILITGATDGIGLETAKTLVRQGHRVLIHGRNREKLESTAKQLSEHSTVETYLADLSKMEEVRALAESIRQKHQRLDVLINNAGILRTNETITRDGLDVRFAVNTIAPYFLTQALWPLFETESRIINLSSAAQSPVDLDALQGRARLDEMSAYAQSKLAITMWSRHVARKDNGGPIIVSVNPASLLGTKMVQEGFGIAGGDLQIGVDILVRSALSDEFAEASGKYFDNDVRRFSDPHPDALDDQKTAAVVSAIEETLSGLHSRRV